MLVMGSSARMSSTVLDNGNFEDFEKDLNELLLENHQQQQHQLRSSRAFIDRSSELNIHRGGSAPPTVEGSMAAVRSLLGKPDLTEAGALLGEEDIRSHPAYLAYYYSTDNLNPRLPPPMVSREDWRAAQRFRAGASPIGRIGDWRKREMSGGGDGSSSSLFSLQPGVSMRDPERELTDTRIGIQRNPVQRASAEWIEQGSDGLTGLTGVGLGARRKSFADVLQDELSRPVGLSSRISRPATRNTFGSALYSVGVSDDQPIQLQDVEIVDSILSGASSHGISRVQGLGSSASHSLASGLGSSLFRSTTLDPQLIRRSPSPCLPPVAVRGDISSPMTDCDDVVTSLSGLNLSKNSLITGENHVEGRLHQEFSDQPEFLFNVPNNHNHYTQQITMSEVESLNIPPIPRMAYKDLSQKNGLLSDPEVSKISVNGQGHLPKRSSSSGIFPKMPPLGPTSFEGSSSAYHNAELPNMDFSGSSRKNFAVNQRSAEMVNNQLDAGSKYGGDTDGQYMGRSGSQAGSGFQVPLVDPPYAQYLQRSDLAAQAALTLNDPTLGRNYVDASSLDIPGYQKAYLGALLAQHKLQHGMPFLGKSAGLDLGYYGSDAYGLGIPYPTSSLSSSILSSPGPGNPPRQNERFSRFPSSGRISTSGSLGSWTLENGIKEASFGSSFLEEFKNNKTKNFELSEIMDHVVEFSVDQYGSRFIQQKLETASVEEKNKIFPEILPHARTLMTDVFGNYVIQKLFEHGTESQRTQLASQLTGHVLPLSLQMYGCRVIQKALEVVEVDQQTQMVSELDGSVMKCVRDQNGNHVIQKCIECVPQEKIQFIISSFYGQVVTLSTHPYGCRVIQRVLEHCDDAKTQSIMMDEILQSVCTLALDQYGNYVVQHVLRNGKPEERTAIISTLAGQIVKMSQQKYASNVVEKCLTFGGPEERQLLINEMLGTTDENEPLQAMMKDQFGNYVVQKVLEICDDQNRELILSRIKVHLNALKRYTYGKHIVARVEKLIATGERHIGITSYSS